MPSVTRRSATAAAARERRADVEQQVLEAVERLLAAGESFTALGIQRIAAEAGMARTTFYGHFADKPTLLIRLAETATAALLRVSSAWVDDDEGTLDELEASIVHLVAECRAHAPLLRAVTEVAAYEPALEQYWNTTVTSIVERCRRRLVRDIAAGRVPADLDPATTAAWVVWGTERVVTTHIAATPDPTGDAAFARGIAAATWASMRRR